jgi:hypothetical protein
MQKIDIYNMWEESWLVRWVIRYACQVYTSERRYHKEMCDNPLEPRNCCTSQFNKTVWMDNICSYILKSI